jgi:hypothetical protein
MRARFASAPDAPPRDQLQEGAARDGRVIFCSSGCRTCCGHSSAAAPAIPGGMPARTGLTDDAAEWAQELLCTSDFAALAEDCGTDIDGLASLYDQLAWQALHVDPNARLLDLLGQIRRGHSERLGVLRGKLTRSRHDHDGVDATVLNRSVRKPQRDCCAASTATGCGG